MTVYVVIGICCRKDVVYVYLNKQAAEERANNLPYGYVIECPIEDYEHK